MVLNFTHSEKCVKIQNKNTGILPAVPRILPNDQENLISLEFWPTKYITNSPSSVNLLLSQNIFI